MKSNVLIGADPELFVFDQEKQVYVSAHDLIPGNKYDPAKVPNGAIQVDGVAAEFNITPAGTRANFMYNIQHVKNIMELIVKKKNPNFHLVASPTATFTKDYFSELPEHVLLLGCEPDYSAYTLKENVKPETALPMRTGSGHIHIGFLDEQLEDSEVRTESHMKVCGSLVRELDFVFHHSAKTWDKDEKRRQLYGSLGAFRPKPYGLEYRVLSNAWLNEDWSQEYVYDVTKAITQRWKKGFSLLKAAQHHKIDNSDLFQLSDFMYRNNLPEIDTYAPALALVERDRVTNFTSQPQSQQHIQVM